MLHHSVLSLSLDRLIGLPPNEARRHHEERHCEHSTIDNHCKRASASMEIKEAAPAEPTVTSTSGTAVESSGVAVSESAYFFDAVARHLPSLEEKAADERWKKWDLSARRCVATFKFKPGFAPGAAEAFLLDLFNSDAVRTAFAPINRRGERIALGSRVAAVKFEPLRATVTSMAFFDRLQDARVVTAVPSHDEDAGAPTDAAGEGVAEPALYIRKRLEEMIDGVPVGDELRDLLLNPDSEHAELFDPASEQRELLFRLLKHTVLGGSMCQFEVRGAGGWAEEGLGGEGANPATGVLCRRKWNDPRGAAAARPCCQDGVAAAPAGKQLRVSVATTQPTAAWYRVRTAVVPQPRYYQYPASASSRPSLQDDARPYLQACRDLYKDLVAVAKDPATGRVVVQSYAYSVAALLGGGAGAASASAGAGVGAGALKAEPLPLFPTDSPHNVCWVVVNPNKYQCTLYYNGWVPFW
jgi:hypothetical protein